MAEAYDEQPEEESEECHHEPKFTELNDLALDNVGGTIPFATDDFFSVAENMLKHTEPEFKEDLFTVFGKAMDGWETRRKRTPGHDWCIIQLGVPGCVYGFDIDTSHFTGNHAPRISIQGACLDHHLPDRFSHMGTMAHTHEYEEIAKVKSEDWPEIMPRATLNPGFKDTAHNYFEIPDRSRMTHLRVNIYPDGGVARLRVYGRAIRDWTEVGLDQLIDLVGMENGGMCVGYSDSHFGHPRHLIHPGRSEVMSDGWETKRHLGRPAVLTADDEGILHVPGYDWCVFRLGHPGTVKKIEIDTNHFKGNYPDSCRIEGCMISPREEKALVDHYDFHKWQKLMPMKKLGPHRRVNFTPNEDCGVISHVRLAMAPDGGISRMRVWGYITDTKQY